MILVKAAAHVDHTNNDNHEVMIMILVISNVLRRQYSSIFMLVGTLSKIVRPPSQGEGTREAEER